MHTLTILSEDANCTIYYTYTVAGSENVLGILRMSGLYQAYITILYSRVAGYKIW